MPFSAFINFLLRQASFSLGALSLISTLMRSLLSSVVTLASFDRSDFTLGLLQIQVGHRRQLDASAHSRFVAFEILPKLHTAQILNLMAADARLRTLGAHQNDVPLFRSSDVHIHEGKGGKGGFRITGLVVSEGLM